MSASASSNRYVDNASERLWKILGDMYGDRFFAQYGPKANDAWREAVKELNSQHVKHAICSLRNSGSPHPPSLPEFISLAKGMRVQTAEIDQPSRNFDMFETFANRRLLHFIHKKGPFTEDSLREILKAKAQLIEDFRLIHDAGEFDSLEAESKHFADALFKTWDRLAVVDSRNEQKQTRGAA
jgi:hypothetical protein